jgi:plasmid stabilization system protein ParE
MRRYVLTPPARDDLREIREYIGLDNPDAALRVVDDLRRRCRALARRPYLVIREPISYRKSSESFRSART